VARFFRIVAFVDTRVDTRVFLGKGGVGKMTCAAATAVHFAQAGECALAISTDPTPSLSHVFEVERGGRQRRIREGLFITELGLEEVRAMWDEKFGRDVYAVFSTFVDIDYPTFVSFVTSVLPGLNEEFVVDYIRRLAREGSYRHVIWDTAPLGQTLALLGTPALLADHVRAAPRICSHLRTSGARRESVMEVLRRWDTLAQECLAFLRDEVRFSMVTTPQALAVRQLDGVLPLFPHELQGMQRLRELTRVLPVRRRAPVSAPLRSPSRPLGLRGLVSPDLVLLHAPALYDFRRHRTLFGPVSDVVPSSAVFEMYPVGFTSLADRLEREGFNVRIVNLAYRMMRDPWFRRGGDDPATTPRRLRDRPALAGACPGRARRRRAREALAPGHAGDPGRPLRLLLPP
jgi:anion-transporting  ArsA/GET3 family ATPase